MQVVDALSAGCFQGEPHKKSIISEPKTTATDVSDRDTKMIGKVTAVIRIAVKDC